MGQTKLSTADQIEESFTGLHEAFTATRNSMDLLHRRVVKLEAALHDASHLAKEVSDHHYTLQDTGRVRDLAREWTSNHGELVKT